MGNEFERNVKLNEKKFNVLLRFVQLLIYNFVFFTIHDNSYNFLYKMFVFLNPSIKIDIRQVLTRT